MYSLWREPVLVKIENGCFRNHDQSWTYPHTTVEGFSQTVFTSVAGQVPEIGDFIDKGKLIKREGYQINNDGKMKWPSDNKDGYVQYGPLYEK